MIQASCAIQVPNLFLDLCKALQAFYVVWTVLQGLMKGLYCIGRISRFEQQETQVSMGIYKVWFGLNGQGKCIRSRLYVFELVQDFPNIEEAHVGIFVIRMDVQHFPVSC